MRDSRRTDGQTDRRTEEAVSVRPSARPPVRLFSKLRSALLQITGMPDYARYLEHARACHADCAPLTEREYYDQFIAMRYGNGGSRCC